MRHYAKASRGRAKSAKRKSGPARRRNPSTARWTPCAGCGLATCGCNCAGDPSLCMCQANYRRNLEPYSTTAYPEFRSNPDPTWGPTLYNPLEDSDNEFKDDSHYQRTIAKLRRNPDEVPKCTRCGANVPNLQVAREACPTPGAPYDRYNATRGPNDPPAGHSLSPRDYMSLPKGKKSRRNPDEFSYHRNPDEFSYGTHRRNPDEFSYRNPDEFSYGTHRRNPDEFSYRNPDEFSYGTHRNPMDDTCHDCGKRRNPQESSGLFTSIYSRRNPDYMLRAASGVDAATGSPGVGLYKSLFARRRNPPTSPQTASNSLVGQGLFKSIFSRNPNKLRRHWGNKKFGRSSYYGV